MPDDFWQEVSPEEYQALGKSGSKFGNVRCQEDGYKFDSLAERDHYRLLKLRRDAGEIAKLLIHPRFPVEVNGVKVCTYIADFAYEEDGALVVIDVKGVRTATYRLKSKLMQAVYGITIQEVAA